MKTMGSRILMILLSVIMLVGCGASETGSQKTEEELREEIKAEMEAEKNQQTASKVRDLDQMYEFINSEVEIVSRKDFDRDWKPYYFDITKDGNDDVAYVNTVGYGNVIFITGDNGTLELLDTDEIYSEYNTKLRMEEEFIIIDGNEHGTGLSGTFFNIAIYSDNKVKLLTDRSLQLEYFAGARTYMKGYSKVEFIDGYRNFNYKFDRYFYDEKNNESHTEAIDVNYKFDESTMSYVVREIGVNFDSINKFPSNNNKQSGQNIPPEQDDYTKGYDIELKNDVLSIIYKNTGNKKGLAYSYGIDFYSKSSFNNERIYFTTFRPKYEEGLPSTYYVNLKTLEIGFAGEGTFFSDVAGYPYSNYVILAREVNGSTVRYVYDQNGNYVCDLGVRVDKDMVAQIGLAIEKESSDAGINYKLSGFADESINGKNIRFSDYMTVVVPMYQGINLKLLSREACSFSDNINNTKLTFAIFGEMQDIRITYFENMGSKGEEENLGTKKNAYIDIYAPFSSDMSHAKVTGKIHRGEGFYSDIEFILDDMRDTDDYDLHLFE